MRWALPLLVLAQLANAQALSKSIRSGGLSPERFPSSGAGAGAAAATALLSFLPSVSASDECTGAVLVAATGQTLNFTRSSSAYCAKSDGTIVLHTSNQARIEANGLLTEETRTNVALRSEELENAVWTIFSGTVTANAGVGPNGASTADRVQISAGDANAVVQQTISGIYEAATHTTAFYVKSNTGSSQLFRLKLTHNGVADFRSADLTATTSWQRFTFSQLFGSTAGSGAVIGVNVPTGATAVDLLVWGAQLEKGQSRATSYIATAGTTVVRSPELASFALTFPEAEGCATATITFPTVKTAGSIYIVGTSGGSNSDAAIYWPSAGTTLGTFATTGGGPTVAAALFGTTSVGRGSWRTLPSLLGSIQVNGATAATQAGTDFAASGTVCLGSTCGSSANFTGYIRALRLENSFAGCL
jgi:hypothetical protein